MWPIFIFIVPFPIIIVQPMIVLVPAIMTLSLQPETRRETVSRPIGFAPAIIRTWK